MTDRLEGLSPLGIDPAARAAPLARVRRDERHQKDGRGGNPQEQPPQQWDDADDVEDDGRPHVDVRA
jgi:hypothetical protein